MGCDMLVALGSATAHGHTLFGLNLFDHAQEQLRLSHLPACSHSPDETIATSQLELPQVRHTSAVLGVQSVGRWGFQFGCNEERVAIGVARWRSRLPATQPGLTGTELTRLALERSHSARHAVEVLTDLIARHGQCDPGADAADSIFLIADAKQACLLEVAGNCWALLECPQTRAVADVAMVRQDWQRLSHGLAETAIHNGWWRDDGTKLDFIRSLARADADSTWSMKRWSKATLALAQQQGAIDAYVLRRMLAEHHETCVQGHPLAPKKIRLLASVVARLDGPGAPLVWFAGGATAEVLQFPLPVGAPLPEAWTVRPPHAGLPAPRAVIERLQGPFDQDAEEYLAEARQLEARGETAALRRLAQAMMHKHLEQRDAEGRRGRSTPTASRPPAPDEELAPYAFG